MTNEEIILLIKKLIRRTGSQISNKAAAANFIAKWTARGASRADPYDFTPINFIEEEVIEALKIECNRAIDIVAMWPASFLTADRVRKLFSIPLACEKQISMLSLYHKEGFLKTSLLRPYKTICRSTTLYSLDEYKEGFLRRHVGEEISCPGAFGSIGNPYGKIIAEIAAISTRPSSPPPPPAPPAPTPPSI